MTTYATLFLGEDDWEIVCPIGEYASIEAAKITAETAEARLQIVEGTACIVVTFADGVKDRVLTPNEVTIRELSPAAQARLGRPLDVTNPQEREKAITALMTMDPAYRIEDADYVPSQRTLADFVARYGSGYKPDCGAYRLRAAP
jgi:hypothetical protein